jgi:hypothetical protein
MIRVSLGVAMILLLTSTAICKAEDFRKKTDQTSGYTQKEVWMAYDGFNKTFLDSNKYIYKTDYPIVLSCLFTKIIKESSGSVHVTV